MSAASILHHLRAEGHALTLQGDGRLKVEPPLPLVTLYDLRDIMAEYRGLASLLQHPDGKPGGLTPDECDRRYGLPLRGRSLVVLNACLPARILDIPASLRQRDWALHNVWLRHTEAFDLPEVTIGRMPTRAFVQMRMPEGRRLTTEGVRQLLAMVQASTVRRTPGRDSPRTPAAPGC